jgi:hypothetical protein
MAEKKIVIEKQEMTYKGLLDIKKLFKEIDQWIREHGYDRYERKNEETVTKDGRQIYIELEPWKSISDYAKAELHVEIDIRDIHDVEVEHDGITEELQRGECHFTFQARLITDYENKWEGSPLYQFIRTIIDKFIHKTQTDTFENECADDCNALREEIKAFLNLFRYKA